MKATGIVRRIDDLGRVVIPKEIRRTLRIREGDALEIYTDNTGGVIFRKYSPIGDLSQTADQYAEVLFQTSGHPVLICDRDHVVAAAGVSRREFLERRVSAELEDCMQNRRPYLSQSKDGIRPVEGMDYHADTACPILVQSDVNGAVVLLGGETPADDTEKKLTQTVAALLAKQMEA